MLVPTLRSRHTSLIAAALAALLLQTSAHATVVERVVAVVGEQAILLSDLRQRARPFLAQMPRVAPAERAAAVSQLMTTLLNRMIDEELQRRAASKARVTVSATEVESALERVAAQNQITVQQLFHEAEQNGLSPAKYREEIRRQLLDAKLMNVRLQGRVRVTEQDLRSTYRKLQMDERRTLTYRAAWIRIDGGNTPTERRRQNQLAARIANEASAGGDFATLARQYSRDESTSQSGGLLPAMRPGQLPQRLDSAILGLDVGEVAQPIRDGNDLVIIKLFERAESQLPEFSQARPQLQQRVYMEKMEKARRHWLDGLRRREHVELRL